jgi:hypothetical protein
MGGAAPLGELVQHAAVSVVALGALAVVLRRVLGVFESRPAAAPGSAGTPHAGGPSCSHCAANTTPQHSSPTRR